MPEVTLAFWVIKIVATTLGETCGDAMSMTMDLGYAIGTVIFIGIFVVAIAAQIAAKSFHPFLYSAMIVAITTAGTTIRLLRTKHVASEVGAGLRRDLLEELGTLQPHLSPPVPFAVTTFRA